MPYSQLTGRTGEPAAASTGRTIGLAVLALAGILGLFAWKAIPRSAAATPSSNPTAQAAKIVAPSPEPVAPIAKPSTERLLAGLSDDQRLHLAHADQELVTVAEQLNAARRVLATLTPALNRNYLQYERRRAENAWAACDAAQGALEQAREHLLIIATTRKD